MVESWGMSPHHPHDDVESSTESDQRSALAFSTSFPTRRHAHVDVSTLPTLFPAPVAMAITTLATSARFSLRISAFFIEMILESSQYSTCLGLGAARRALISAISSARSAYLLSSSPMSHFDLDKSQLAGDSDPASSANFLDVLDRYTNIGIYIVHHAFTLAELFTMSGFYLTANAIHTAHAGATESVELFDSLFGSTDSSRTLSAIITLLRKEVLDDDRFKEKDKGAIRCLTALTKALTAFACLQVATWKHTSTKHRMKLLYDCTVLKERSLRQATARPTRSTLHIAALGADASEVGEHKNSEAQVSSSTAQAQENLPNSAAELRHDWYEIHEEFAESSTTTQMCSRGRQPPIVLHLADDQDGTELGKRPADHILQTMTDRTSSRRLVFRRIEDVRSIPWFRTHSPGKAEPSTATSTEILPLVPVKRQSTVISLPRTKSMRTLSAVQESQPRAHTDSMTSDSQDPSESASHTSVMEEATRRVSKENIQTRGPDTPQQLFPHESLLKNIHRFMRFSSAAYGQNFLRILGLGSTDYTFPSTEKHHANTWAFAQHTNLPIDSVILSSHPETTQTIGSQKATELVHYLAVHHQLKAVVLTCRGTLGLSDILTDLTCDYCPVEIDGQPQADFYAHSGMYRSALGLTSRRSSVHRAIQSTLARYTDYGLVVTGHSLGGGVAALLTIISAMPASVFLDHKKSREDSINHPPITTPFVTSLQSGLPPGRPVHCYTYGVPAIVSPDLAKYTKGLITSVIHNSDIVPSLSLGVLRDLKNISLTLFEEGNVAEEIVTRVLGSYTRRSMNSALPRIGNGDDDMEDWMISLIKTMRADMDNDKLYPPGDVYIMEYHNVFVPAERGEGMQLGEDLISHKQAQRVILHKCESVVERFSEPMFSKTMLKDHMPTHYERATQLLFDGINDHAKQ